MNISTRPTTILMSWDDYRLRRYDRSQIPWHNFRWEDGEVVTVGKEGFLHSLIAERLMDLIDAWISENGEQWLCLGGKLEVEVRHSKHRGRIPDLLVISYDTAMQLSADNLDTITWDMPAPILVVEVLSPSSVKTDLEDKDAEYWHRGVGEYMSIDRQNKSIIVRSRAEDGSYIRTEYGEGDAIALSTMPGLKIEVDRLIAEFS
ncbi:MAG: Uma2 family endonuclease [Cyanobacteria bacterium P01_F01_bin.150]